MFSAGSVVDIRTGDVAVHEDEISHLAIILTIQGDECGALFFTSNPHWAAKCRKATEDEISMAGFRGRTKVTYLAYVRRRRWDFVPTGQTFPNAWIEGLIQEFEADQAQVVVQTT
jgi:hypothetical protein